MKRLTSLLMLIALAFSLCACDVEAAAVKPTVKQTVSNNTVGNSSTYMIHENISLPDADVKIAKAVLSGDDIIMCGWDKERNATYYKYSCATLEVSRFAGLPDRGTIDISGLHDGGFAVMATAEDGTIFVTEVNAMGAILDPVEVKTTLFDEDIAIGITLMDNSWLIQTTTQLFAIDKRGQLVKNLGNYSGAMDVLVNTENTFLLINSYGNSKDASYAEGSVKITEYDTKLNVVDSYWLANNYTKYLDVNESVLLVESSNTIYQLNFQRDERTVLADAFLSGIDSFCFLQIDEGRYFSFYDGKPAIWSFSDVEDTQILTVAAYNINPLLSSAIAEFNGTNGRYLINIVDYASYDENGTEELGLVRMNADIMSGNTPDIYDLSYFHADQLAANGKLQDLKPFYESDSEISYDSLIPNVAKALEYNGGAYVLVPRFGVNALFTNKHIVDSLNGWSVEKLEVLLSEYGSTALFGPEFDRLAFWEYVLTYGSDWLIDTETLKCCFNSDDFVELMILSSDFPPNSENADGSTPDGRAFMGEQFFMYDNMVNMLALALNEGVFGSDIQYLPFPADKNAGLAVYTFFGVGMSSSSNCKEGVWQFFKFLLNCDSQLYGIPIRFDLLDDYIEESSNLEYKTYTLMAAYENQMVPIESAEIDEEMKQQLKCLIEQVDRSYGGDDAILEIIMDVGAAYYAGDKTAEEVAENIQSRVSIYLSEQYG